MERKYNQHGYQDDSPKNDRQQPAPAKDREGPRSPKMMAYQGVIRCAMCGERVELMEMSLDSACPKCNADLRTCRNCTNFDPGARFECRAPIAKRVGNKTVRTECDAFAPKRTVEKKTGETRGPSKPDDPRAAFDRLFKR